MDSIASTSRNQMANQVEQEAEDGPTVLQQRMREMEQDLERGELPELENYKELCQHPNFLGLSHVQLSKIFCIKNLEGHFAKHPNALFKSFLELSVPSEVLEADAIAEPLRWIIRHDMWSRAKNKRLGQHFLRWIKCLLQYALLEPEKLKFLYEPLFMFMTHVKDVRPTASEVLLFITTHQEVTKCRLKILEKLLKQSKSSPNSGDKRAILNLIDQYKILKPQLIPESLNKIEKRTVPSLRKEHFHDLMTHTFEKIWKDRNPIDIKVDELTSDSHLTWTNDEIFIRSMMKQDIKPPSKKRFRKLPQVLPYPMPNPIEVNTAKNAVYLYQCTKVSDIYDNLPNLVQPSQTLSLLNNRGTFPLLILNKNPKAVISRLSLTLYSLLHNEFFGSVPDSNSPYRQRFLLQRASLLQEHFQEGIPVVARFLSEFLSSWDGESFFIEIMHLVSFIQITDFEEFHECILAPLTCLFFTKFKFSHRLFLIVYLHKLLMHWINLEYDRCKMNHKNRFSGADNPEFESDRCEMNHKNRIFGVANPDCKSALEPILGLMNDWTNVIEVGLVKNMAWGDEKISEMDKLIYVNEILGMCLSICRLLIKRNVPLRFEIPHSLIQYALFDSSPIFLSQVAEYITMTKHELLPVLRRVYRKEVEDESLNNDIDIIKNLIEDKKSLNAVTLDMLAVLSCNTVILDNHSIFRKYWELEEDKILNHLKITSHPAMLPYVLSFVERYSKENNISKGQVFDLLQQKGEVYDEYMDVLGKALPRITEFLHTCDQKQIMMPPKNLNSSYPQSVISHPMTEFTTTTSGISSLHPKTRRSRRKRSLEELQ